MEIPSGYKFDYQRLNPITWLTKVTTPNNLIFVANIQCGPQQPNDAMIFNTLIDKGQRQNFVLEMQENKDYWVIRDEIKEEIKAEVAPKIAPEIKLEIQPSGNNL